MALLCYNKGCGLRFDPEDNHQDSCLYHPGLPIFHDAVKGWSCCKKRTSDFSEFLSIKSSPVEWLLKEAGEGEEEDPWAEGCTKGFHGTEKPPEAKDVLAVIVRGPKSAEEMERERPSSDEPKQLLEVKVSRSLEQALEKLDSSPTELPVPPHGPAGTRAVLEANVGTTCKNAGCKVICQGEESNLETCVFHPGSPVFHEGMKYWSCCGIKTTDFTAFLEQKGCSRGKHTWVKRQDKKVVSCRQDWHQTGSQVVVTVYAKTPLPDLCSVKANHTVLDIHVTFEGDKVFQAELGLWGVIKVEKSFVNMLPSKVEITLHKGSPGTWARLEHPQSPSQVQRGPLEPDTLGALVGGGGSLEEESEDSFSWSEEDEEGWEEENQSQGLSGCVSDGN